MNIWWSFGGYHPGLITVLFWTAETFWVQDQNSLVTCNIKFRKNLPWKAFKLLVQWSCGHFGEEEKKCWYRPHISDFGKVSGKELLKGLLGSKHAVKHVSLSYCCVFALGVCYSNSLEQKSEENIAGLGRMGGVQRGEEQGTHIWEMWRWWWTFLASVADRLKIQQLVRLLNQSQVNHLYDHASIL